MRRKRTELEQAVIRAAREWRHVDRTLDLGDLVAKAQAVIDAVDALDAHNVAQITAAGVPYAAGSDTSYASAQLSKVTQGSARMEIVGQLARVSPLAGIGYTDEQLERRLGKSHQTVSSARNWLVQAGWVRDSGERRINAGSKRPAAVWTLTEAAWRELRQQ
jgi:hypothetical protein